MRPAWSLVPWALRPSVFNAYICQRGLLAKCVVPACMCAWVGKGVRLGSESLSDKICESGKLKLRGPGNLELHGELWNLENWNPVTSHIYIYMICLAVGPCMAESWSLALGPYLLFHGSWSLLPGSWLPVYQHLVTLCCKSRCACCLPPPSCLNISFTVLEISLQQSGGTGGIVWKH